jgi:DNA polymerase-1
MHGLIDADILVFRAGFAAEKNRWYLTWDPDPTVSENRGVHRQSADFQYKKDALAKLDEVLPGKYSREEGDDYALWSERVAEPVENALYLVKRQMQSIMEDCDLSEFDVTCFLSGGHNFRYDVAKSRPYKGNRDKSHRPTHEEAIKEYILRTWNTVVTDGIEADDAMGRAQLQDDQTCIISIDKDLDMIPGLHYNFKDELHYSVTPEQGWRIFCKQLLTGDATDNIPGLPNVGAVKAEKILDGIETDDMLQVVASEYASRSGKRDWFAYLQEQAQLIWIQQTGKDILDILEPYREGGFEHESNEEVLLY